MTLFAESARAWFAEDIRVTCNIKSPRVIEAIAAVPRERFLGPGPWLFRAETDMAGPRTTDDADPKRVYHNVAIAIDAARNLYNGQPGLIARWLDMLAVAPGDKVLHIGCGTGYFTALIAHIVGPSGHVIAIDVDPGLADRATANLTDWPWVDVSAGDGRSHLPANRDVVLVHAGATHVLDAWLDALRDGGRLLVPLTVAVPGMPAGISKGAVLTARRSGDQWSATVSHMVAIYSLLGARDDAMAAKLGEAFRAGKAATVTRLRRDRHEPDATCWVHGDSVCVSTG
jgi:protein-L-isoaspartate(D-aspartate) O-methyltransferase